ncbi:MAG: DUF4160 domain-containing protein [Nitrospinae bacterium]|nr:DUF4160 domain-containing protein [Nitrospinota bacterium]
MPVISRFFGIIISMYYEDHAPPHFHARYGEQKVILEIKTLKVLQGQLSARTLGLVTEWASAHQEELMEDWNLAQNHASLKPISPLE